MKKQNLSNGKTILKKLSLVCLFLAIICSTTLTCYADTITDSFSGGIDLANWTPWVSPASNGPPSIVVGTDDWVLYTLGGLYTGDPDPSSGGGLIYNPTVSGNFSATVDFFLLDWEPILPRGIRVGIGADMIGSVARIGDPSFGGNSYLVNFTPMGGSLEGITPAYTLSGSLKLTRFADTISGYYMDSTTNGDWVLISEQEKYYAGQVMLSFGTWAHTDSAIGRHIAFDNFTLTQHPVTEPSTLLLLGSGLAGLIGYGKRGMRK
jgi:hypothetical protein